MTGLNPKMLHVSKHRRDRMIGGRLSDNLRQQYKFRSIRIIKGDSIKIMRGEYKGVEGKVEEVITHSGSLLIEGVQREKIRGGNVRVPIHASNVMLINLNLDDRQRSARLRGVSKSSEEEPDRSKTGAKDEEKSKQEASA